MKDNALYDGLFAYIGYLVTSAQGLFNEPKDYGSFRLFEGASKICTILENEETQYGDFFTKLRELIDENKFLMMTDMETFVKAVDESVAIYVKKAREMNI